MEKIIDTENDEIKFKFNEGANCWQSQTIFDNLEIEIEIDHNYHKENEVDWEHFKNFYSFLNKENRLKKLLRDSKNLVSELGKAFYRDCYENVADYEMSFSNSIFYNGKTDGNFVQNGYSYYIVYNYNVKRENGIYGDEYGIYLVQIENQIIVGVKRQQC